MATEPQFVFGVDLDGVVFDQVESMIPVAADHLGVDPASLNPYPLDYNFADWGLTRDQLKAVLFEWVVARRSYLNLNLFPGVREHLWALSEAGVHIRIITHRLFIPGQHALAAADTVASLEANNIPHRDLCFMEAKADLGADIYVDDAPHNINALVEAGKEVITFDQSYNQGTPGIRAKGWTEVEAIVMDRYEAWKSANLAV